MSEHFEKFTKLNDHKIVDVIDDPKPNMLAGHCFDNSAEYCDAVSDWELAGGWLWSPEAPKEMSAHVWVKKRKKHKEITNLDIDKKKSYYYVYSKNISEWLKDADQKFKQGDPNSVGALHQSYLLIDNKWSVWDFRK